MAKKIVPRSYVDIATFAETYEKILNSYAIIMMSGGTIAQASAKSGLIAIKKYKKFPKALRDMMDFDSDKIKELEKICKEELEIIN